jgi:hypothetical protein
MRIIVVIEGLIFSATLFIDLSPAGLLDASINAGSVRLFHRPSAGTAAEAVLQSAYTKRALDHDGS